MKHLLFFVLLISLFSQEIEAQTNVNIPGPENVLVIYNSLDQTSIDVKDYYQLKRGIPESNIVPLNDLISHDITIDGITHPVIIAQETDIIRDSINNEIGTWYATEHAWKYFYQYVALPIKNHITSNNLTSISYIVLCKGVPFKVQAGGDFGSVLCNVTVDGLLCMLITDNYEAFLHSVYADYRSRAIDINHYYYNPMITNPYYDADPNLNMNSRFIPGVFIRNWNGHTIKLDYLVSHLDGISYNMVKEIIDLSSEAIHSDNYDWFIDADPIPCRGGDIMVSFANLTASKLNSSGFSNYSFDITEDTVTYHYKPVMSYSSNGIHTTLGPYAWPYCQNYAFSPDYIQSSLNFNYEPGAIFNTAESFNAELLSSISRRPGAEMGQVVEFLLKGGTLAVGYGYEPLTTGIVRDGIMFPSYQVGYSFIDAAYMGMPYLAWQNVVVGDPLTAIAWGKQSLTTNLSWSGTNLVTGEVYVSNSRSLTIANNSTINLKHQGFITGDGEMIIGLNVTFNIYSWQKGLFLSYDSDHPRIVWGRHPTYGVNASYKVYRKINSTGTWSLIATTTALEYTDNQMLLEEPLPGELPPNLFYDLTPKK